MIPHRDSSLNVLSLSKSAGLYTAPGDVNSVFVKLLFSMPDIFTSHFIFLMNQCSEKPTYNTVLNSLDPLPYLKIEAIKNACYCLGVCVISLNIVYIIECHINAKFTMTGFDIKIKSKGTLFEL